MERTYCGHCYLYYGRPVPKYSSGGTPAKKKKKKGQKKGRSSYSRSGSLATLNDPSRKDEDNKKHPVPQSFTTAFDAAMSTIQSLPQAAAYDLCFDSNASPVMQILLLYSEDKNAVDSLAKHLLDWKEFEALNTKLATLGESDDEKMSSLSGTIHKWLDEMIQGRSSSHVIEAMLLRLEGVFRYAFSKCFIGRLSKYSQLPSANFVVQQLLACLRVKSQVAICVKELVIVIPEILGSRTCLGVVWRLLECCIAHGTKGKDVCRALIQAASSSNRDVVESLLGLTLGTTNVKSTGEDKESHPHASSSGDSSAKTKRALYVDIAGARVIQQLLRLHFAICRPILQSIVDLPSRTLQLWQKILLQAVL